MMQEQADCRKCKRLRPSNLNGTEKCPGHFGTNPVGFDFVVKTVTRDFSTLRFENELTDFLDI